MVARFLLGAVLVVAGFAIVIADFHYTHAAHLLTVLPGTGTAVLGALVIEPECVGPALTAIAQAVRLVRPKGTGGPDA